MQHFVGLSQGQSIRSIELHHPPGWRVGQLAGQQQALESRTLARTVEASKHAQWAQVEGHVRKPLEVPDPQGRDHLSALARSALTSNRYITRRTSPVDEVIASR